MSGRRAKKLRKLFSTLYPPSAVERRALWREFKRKYISSNKSERREFMDQ